jgi:hypothetical protein
MDIVEVERLYNVILLSQLWGNNNRHAWLTPAQSNELVYQFGELLQLLATPLKATIRRRFQALLLFRRKILSHLEVYNSIEAIIALWTQFFTDLQSSVESVKGYLNDVLKGFGSDDLFL